MATVHLTDKLARETSAPAKGYAIVNDTRVAGFGLLITANGARSFVFRYRHARRSQTECLQEMAAADHAFSIHRHVDRFFFPGHCPFPFLASAVSGTRLS